MLSLFRQIIAQSVLRRTTIWDIFLMDCKGFQDYLEYSVDFKHTVFLTECLRNGTAPCKMADVFNILFPRKRHHSSFFSLQASSLFPKNVLSSTSPWLLVLILPVPLGRNSGKDNKNTLTLILLGWNWVQGKYAATLTSPWQSFKR